jgi:hypothetical protein
MANALADANLTEEEIESLTLAFHMYDLDGSGGIDAYELKLALQSMGQNPTEEEILELMGAIDEDGSGSIGACVPPGLKGFWLFVDSIVSVCFGAGKRGRGWALVFRCGGALVPSSANGAPELLPARQTSAIGHLTT